MRLLFYNCLLLILLPLMVIRIFLKSIKDKDYIRNFKNRFGVYNEKSKTSPVWFHAVSLGEVISSKNLVKKILEEEDVVLTVSTPTGLREAEKIYKDKVHIVYAPWDFIIFVNSFLSHFEPKALILFETEIWPTFISRSRKKKLPIILSNARLSKSSYKRYKSLKFFFKDVFNMFSIILVQSKKHADRFESIGVNKKAIYKVGSVKFDNDSKPLFPKYQPLHDSAIQQDIILATSTHKGEDEIVVKSFIKLKKEIANLKLIIAPRHPERSISISDILRKNNIKNIILEDIPTSLNDFCNKVFNENDAIVIGQTGLLNDLYQMALVSFIGGSLISKYGGHNIIEAAANECPFVVGPYMRNFEDILDTFISKDACIKLSHPDQLTSAFRKLLNDDLLRTFMIDNALNVINENQGSTKKQFKYIKNILK